MPTLPTGLEPKTPVIIRDTSATERAAFRRCRRSWFLGVVHRLYVVEGNQNFWFGTLVHAALEEFYRALLENGGQDYDSASARSLDVYQLEYDKSLVPIREHMGFLWSNVEPTYRELGEMGIEMLQAYFDRERRDPIFDEIVEVERRVWVPIRDPRRRVVGYLSVRTDLVGRRRGRLGVADHKTASREMDERQLDLDDQLSAEVYAVWKSRDDQEFPEDAVYNVLYKRVPRAPKQLKPGKDGKVKLSKDKSQGTTYDLYIEEIHRLGLDAEDYEDILQTLYNIEQAGESQFYKRTRVTRNAAQMSSFEKNLYQEYRDMKVVASQPERAYPNPSPFSCPSCSVRLVCLAMNDGGDVEALIKASYVVGDPRR